LASAKPWRLEADICSSLFIFNFGLLNLTFVHMYLQVIWPNTNRPSCFSPILFLAWSLGGQTRKHKNCYNSWTNGWDRLQIFIIGTSNKGTWHNPRVFDLTYFWRSKRSKFKTAPLVGTFRY
jgi:hypothetical protein